MTYVRVRDSLMNQPGIQGGERRRLLTDALDAWLGVIFDTALGACDADPRDFALVAVGSLGRGEVTFNSDLDLVLIHRPKSSIIDRLASAVWYPIWDSGIALDHSVRTVEQARKTAAGDLKVMTGLLDSRHVCGNSELSAELRDGIHSDWRKSSKKLLPKLRELVIERQQRSGELFQLLEPDVKESYGGLRDVAVLRAMAATWQFEVMQQRWKSSSEFLLDLRDCLHMQSRGDRLRLQDQMDVAQQLQFESPSELLQHVYLAGRSIAYASDRLWSQCENPIRKRDVRRPLAEGVVSFNGEVVLARSVLNSQQHGSSILPSVGLSLVAAAARYEMPISQSVLDRFEELFGVIHEPWTEAMRESFISILGSKYAMRNLWESLDQAGVIAQWIPEWESVRSLPQFNPLHEFTVDRHLIECVLNAHEFTRTVSRPDLLLIACLLHDIGKGFPGDHSEVGSQIAVDVMRRMAFSDSDVSVVELLVRHHLLLADTATRRDINDSPVIDELASALKSAEVAELLHALTIADSRATGPSLRSQWRENLISDAALRTSSRFSGKIPPGLRPEIDLTKLTPDRDGLIFDSRHKDDGFEIVVGYPDQKGLLAQVAGVLTLHRLHVRAADLYGQGNQAVQVWKVKPLFGDLPDESLLRRDLKMALGGMTDLAPRLATYFLPDQTAVVSWQAVSDSQMVIEVRARDRKGLLFDIAHAIATAGLSIVGARITTLGLDVIDVFFVRNSDGSYAETHTVELAVEAVRARLTESH